MEIYEKTVEVLEPEVTKLMKFMYFQVRGPGWIWIRRREKAPVFLDARVWMSVLPCLFLRHVRFQCP